MRHVVIYISAFSFFPRVNGRFITQLVTTTKSALSTCLLLHMLKGTCKIYQKRLCLVSGCSQTVKYCGLGLKVNELIEATGNQVTVQFMSGTHHSGRGFYLSYSTTEHTGNTLSHHSPSSHPLMCAGGVGVCDGGVSVWNEVLLMSSHC